MPKKPNTHGGGANTNIHGLHFEQTTSLNDALQANGFQIINQYEVKKGDELIGYSVPKNALYSYFLAKKQIDYSRILSKKLLPDEAFVNIKMNQIYIIEKKFQSSNGSVDEKLQTCHFKLKQYKKLFKSLKCSVAYYYYLCDWYKDKKYKDVLKYIKSVKCKYFFDYLPLEEIGLNPDQE